MNKSARDIVDYLISMADDRDFLGTCDTFKCGNPDCKVTKVAVAMFGTYGVIKKAAEWGAEFLIVHEPLYYSNSDTPTEDIVELKKRRLIEESGLTIFRYHDYAHYATPDFIVEGVLNKLEFEGEIEHTDIVDLARIHLDTPLTPVELAHKLEAECGLKHLRISGTRDVKCSKISLVPGWLNVAFTELQRKETEIVITGETNECFTAEYARDASEEGFTKALIVLGHIASERDGMIYITDVLSQEFPDIIFKYFECGDVYSLVD